jgi:hypothetical protein
VVPGTGTFLYLAIRILCLLPGILSILKMLCLKVESGWVTLMHKFMFPEKSMSDLRVSLGSIEALNSICDLTKDVSMMISALVRIPALESANEKRFWSFLYTYDFSTTESAVLPQMEISMFPDRSKDIPVLRLNSATKPGPSRMYSKWSWRRIKDWKAVVRSDAVPDQTCPISSLWPLKKTKGRIWVSRMVSSIPAVAVSSSPSASPPTNPLKPPAKIPNWKQHLIFCPS